MTSNSFVVPITENNAFLELIHMKNVKLIFKAVALAMGVSTLILSILGDVSINTAITLLSIGVTCLAIVQLQDKEK